MDDPIVVGNYFNKYESGNPLVRRLMQRFARGFDELAALSGATLAHEVGCGEGYLCERLLTAGFHVKGSELSPDVVAVAKARLAHHPGLIGLKAASIYDLQPRQDAAGLIVCCEVLEHLPDPDAALDILAGLADPWLLTSVPHEPWWRILNAARGKYLAHLGNTPGHLQHWSRTGFQRFLNQRFDIVASRPVFPWTMFLAKTKEKGGSQRAAP